MSFVRSLPRFAAAAKTASTGGVPNVLVSFGTRANKISFISHPGVMAISKLLEMRFITRPRAVFTQENVDAIREFDPELADKAQMALDNGISINFMDLEYIDKPEFLQMLKNEKGTLANVRDEVLKSPPGQYSVPRALKSFQTPTVPRSWRPELEIGEDIFSVQPELREGLQLQDKIRQHISQQITEGKAKSFFPVSGAGQPNQLLK